MAHIKDQLINQTVNREIDMAIITGTPGDDSASLGGNDLIGTSGDDDIFSASIIVDYPDLILHSL